MLFSLKMVTLINFLHNILSITCDKKGILYPSKIIKCDKEQVEFDTEEFQTSHYYNPVDEEWKIEKCRSLGFTYKEPIKEQKFTSFMVPVDSFFNSRGIYHILAEVVCGDRKIRNQLRRNILRNLKENEAIKQFLGEDNFQNYVESITLTEPMEPDRKVLLDKCPVCYEDSTVIVRPCRHTLCYECSDKLIIKKQVTCPLCRKDIERFVDIEGDIKSACGCVELFAAAYYLDVCIYVYDTVERDWLVYCNDWPNYNDRDMKDKKCIYLYETPDRLGIVHNVIQT